jgi:hypothetical protein|tara:strand:+ start:52 stop:315 length:264 start_codon:yes stop_codon:yes gene_type:complete
MREMLISAARTYYMGMINKHVANVEILLTNPVGIGEDSHQDIQAVIEIEMGKIADYHDKLEMLQKFFVKPQQQEQLKAEEKKKDDKS